MRRFRWLLPVAILGIVGAVADLYLKQRALLEKNAPARPPLLTDGVQGQAIQWCFNQAQAASQRVEICATKMNDTGTAYELEGLQLKLFHKDARIFDLVTSDFAKFNVADRKLFSEGNVAITMGVPVEGVRPGRLLKIHSSGVEFSSETGEASSTRPVRFEFDRGMGSSVGAHYAPDTKALTMDRYVWLEWKSKNPAAPPMHLEADKALYLEEESKVVLSAHAKLTRGGLTMEGADTEVHLKEGNIERVDTANGHGTQVGAGRKVDFASNLMHILFDENSTVSYIMAEHDARVTSFAPTARTHVTTQRLDLHFAPTEHESVLTSANATGASILTAEPVVRAGIPTPETRVLRGEILNLFMRPQTDEIDRVETTGAGTLEFLPNAPTQLKRTLNGNPIWIYYGPENRIERFRSLNVTTRTETKAPRTTESKEMLAFFDAHSVLTRLEQNTDFRYEEGERKANARRATFEQASNLLTLDGAASTSDPSGRVNAERILMDQTSGDFSAEGSVSTTRQPTRKGGSSAMLSGQEITQATAKKMTSTHNNQRIRYEGDAKAWQGANRVTADTLQIDQETHIMEARGHVETQFADKAAKGGVVPFTTVRAQELEYSTETRIAHYRGGAHLDRPNLTVDSRELHAFLKEANAETSLEKAVAEGAVKIVSTNVVPGKAKRTRTGTSEHGEYYTETQKVILTGPGSQLSDSEGKQTTGRELTWWANDDRLLVDGEEQRQTRTSLPKKK